MEAFEFAAIEFVTPCARCGAPAPVNAPVQATRCPSCHEETPVPEDIWREALQGIELDVILFGRGYTRAGPEFWHSEHSPPPRVQWVRGRAAPACARCGGRMDPFLSQGACLCVTCRAARPLIPAPDWLKRANGHVAAYVSDEDATPSHSPRVKRRFWLVVHLHHDPRRALPDGRPAARARAKIMAFVAVLALALLAAPVYFLVGWLDTLGIMPTPALWAIVLAVLFASLFAAVRAFVLAPLQRHDRIYKPENEIIGRLHGPVSSGRVQVLLTPIGQPSSILDRRELSMTEKGFASLGGEGAPLRAWHVPGRPDLTVVKPEPTALE